MRKILFILLGFISTQALAQSVQLKQAYLLFKKGELDRAKTYMEKSFNFNNPSMISEKTFVVYSAILEKKGENLKAISTLNKMLKDKYLQSFGQIKRKQGQGDQKVLRYVMIMARNAVKGYLRSQKTDRKLKKLALYFLGVLNHYSYRSKVVARYRRAMLDEESRTAQTDDSSAQQEVSQDQAIDYPTRTLLTYNVVAQTQAFEITAPSSYKQDLDGMSYLNVFAYQKVWSHWMLSLSAYYGSTTVEDQGSTSKPAYSQEGIPSTGFGISLGKLFARTDSKWWEWNLNFSSLSYSYTSDGVTIDTTSSIIGTELNYHALISDSWIFNIGGGINSGGFRGLIGLSYSY